MPTGNVDVRRAGDRFCTLAAGSRSWHCFSFGPHYDPANTGFGPLVACNDELLESGGGYDPHRHADVEIVTWVVSGSLTHIDSVCGRRAIGPAGVQRLSAGSGVVHSEKAESQTNGGQSGTVQATRFIQMWLTPDEPGGEPAYDQRLIEPEALTSGYCVVASGRPEHRSRGAIPIARAGAALLARRLVEDQSVSLPDADLLHLFVVRGAVELDTGATLVEGDSARMRSAEQVVVECRSPAEILVWQLDEPLRL